MDATQIKFNTNKQVCFPSTFFLNTVNITSHLQKIRQHLSDIYILKKTKKEQNPRGGEGGSEEIIVLGEQKPL